MASQAEKNRQRSSGRNVVRFMRNRCWAGGKGGRGGKSVPPDVEAKGEGIVSSGERHEPGGFPALVQEIPGFESPLYRMIGPLHFPLEESVQLGPGRQVAMPIGGGVSTGPAGRGRGSMYRWSAQRQDEP